MLRIDTHKYNCSFYRARDNIVRQLYRALLLESDSNKRFQIAHTILEEAEFLGTPQGRRNHPCHLCRHISRMRVTGTKAFMRNFRFDNTAQTNLSAPSFSSMMEILARREQLIQ